MCQRSRRQGFNPWEYEWAGGYNSFLNDPISNVLFTVEECVFQPVDGDVC